MRQVLFQLTVLLTSLLSCRAFYSDKEPLLLTQYINHGKIDEGKDLARNKPLLGNTESYSGFLTVNATALSNLFFWYFPAENDTGGLAPVAIWLNGGPGYSSFVGQFFQIGPYALEGDVIKKREFYWSKEMHVLFIDNPVGTGYSFTVGNDYPTDEQMVGAYLLNAVTQFYQLFPTLNKRKLYLTGDSYGGKYIIALAHNIHVYNKETSFKQPINLKGVAIGNGLIDPINQLVQGSYWYELGLVDEIELSRVKKHIAKIVENIKAEKWKEASTGFKELFWNYEGEPTSIVQKNTGFTWNYNLLFSEGDSWARLSKLVKKVVLKRNLHVGSLPFNDGRMSETYLFNDMMKSVLPWFREILDHYDVLLYSGQLDLILPYPTQEKFLRKMAWPQKRKYFNTPRKIWKVGNYIAGYTKTVYYKQEHTDKELHFTHILVRNAGHLVTMDQPAATYDMIMRFTTKKTPF